MLQGVPDGQQAQLHDTLRVMELATISLAAASGAIVVEATSPSREDGAGGRSEYARVDGLPPGGRSLCEALSEMQVAMSELRIEVAETTREPEPDKAVMGAHSLSGCLMSLELTLKQLAGTESVSRLPQSNDDTCKPAPVQEPTAVQQLLDSIARATEAIGGPQTLAGYQAARSQALTRKMCITPGQNGPERLRNSSVPDILIPRPEIQSKTRPPAPVQASGLGAPPTWMHPEDDHLWEGLLGNLTARRMKTARADQKVVRKDAGQVYMRVPPPPSAFPTLLLPTGAAPATPVRLIPEPPRRSSRPLYLGKIPHDAKLSPTAAVEPRSHAGKTRPASSAYAPGHHAKLAAKATAAAIKANTQAIRALALT
jgi:hypothetical protein